jgi:hypothetical protein
MAISRLSVVSEVVMALAKASNFNVMLQEQRLYNECSIKVRAFCQTCRQELIVTNHYDLRVDRHSATIAEIMEFCGKHRHDGNTPQPFALVLNVVQPAVGRKFREDA